MLAEPISNFKQKRFAKKISNLIKSGKLLWTPAANSDEKIVYIHQQARSCSGLIEKKKILLTHVRINSLLFCPPRGENNHTLRETSFDRTFSLEKKKLLLKVLTSCKLKDQSKCWKVVNNRLQNIFPSNKFQKRDNNAKVSMNPNARWFRATSHLMQINLPKEQ